jgi:hypothetical protein
MWFASSVPPASDSPSGEYIGALTHRYAQQSVRSKLDRRAAGCCVIPRLLNLTGELIELVNLPHSDR